MRRALCGISFLAVLCCQAVAAEPEKAKPDLANVTVPVTGV